MIANRDKLTRALVKRHVQDADRVFLSSDTDYAPQTADHRKLWAKLKPLIGDDGVWYSTLRAACGSNKHFVAYLVGDIGALRIPAVEERLGITE